MRSSQWRGDRLKADEKVIKPRARQETVTIGDIEIANRVLLAPMSGITDAPFRRLAAELGAGLFGDHNTAPQFGGGKPEWEPVLSSPK